MPAQVSSTIDLVSFTGSETAIDQGDGFYLAVFNATGHAKVESTPMYELQEIDLPILINPSVARSSAKNLQK